MKLALRVFLKGRNFVKSLKGRRKDYNIIYKCKVKAIRWILGKHPFFKA